MKSRGALIVFEGLDRSGKSTQAKLLLDALTSDKFRLVAELWKYPNRETSIGTLINEYLTNKREMNDHAVHLLFSANRWETIDEMKKKLTAGQSIVVDRYAYSGAAYSAAKSGMNFEWCKQCDIGLPKPDVVFFLDTSTKVTGSRSEFGAERYEKSEFQELVYQNFKKFFTGQADSNFCVVDAGQTIEKIHEEILSEALKTIEKCKFQNMASLW